MGVVSATAPIVTHPPDTRPWLLRLFLWYCGYRWIWVTDKKALERANRLWHNSGWTGWPQDTIFLAPDGILRPLSCCPNRPVQVHGYKPVKCLYMHKDRYKGVL